MSHPADADPARSPGSELAHLRWAKTSKAEKRAVVAKLQAAKRRKEAERRTAAKQAAS